MAYMKLQAELADCRHAYTDMKARAERAEAALAAVPVAELRRLAEMRRLHQWSSVESPPLWAAVEAWLESHP